VETGVQLLDAFEPLLAFAVEQVELATSELLPILQDAYIALPQQELDENNSITNNIQYK
jgi:hypothetical protein